MTTLLLMSLNKLSNATKRPTKVKKQTSSVIRTTFLGIADTRDGTTYINNVVIGYPFKGRGVNWLHFAIQI